MRTPGDPKIEKWFRAAKLGDVTAVIDMLESGLDVNVGDSRNTTALMYAARFCHVELIRTLLDRGALLSARTSTGFTALTHALIQSRSWGSYRKVRSPDRRPLELLLAAGARYELREAVMMNDVPLATARLDEGADPNTGQGSYLGPLLMIAAELGYPAIVDLLLQRGAKIEATDDLGRRPLLSAARYGWTRVVQLLLERGAELNGDDWDDNTALSEAAVHGHSRVVRLLIDRGANPNAVDRDGKTALDLATEKGHTAVAEVLKAAGG